VIVAIAIGGLAGACSGLVSGFLASLVVLSGKRARNARLMARGEPGYKDCVRTPLEIPYAVIGLLAGGVIGAIGGDPRSSALAGGALPLLWMMVGLAVSIAQAMRRSEPPQ
jgi:hypothetical protein